MKKNPRFPNKLLIAGMSLILGGMVILFLTLGFFSGVLSWLFALWPTPLILGGLLVLYFVYLQGKPSHLILPGMFLVLGGVFFLLYNVLIPEKSIERLWPAFMDIAGLSLLPYAFKRKKKARVGLIISSVTLIVFSLLFFPFSLKIVGMSFLQFATQWWPVIIIVVGLILIAAYSLNKHRKTEPSAQKKARAVEREPKSKSRPS